MTSSCKDIGMPAIFGGGGDEDVVLAQVDDHMLYKSNFKDLYESELPTEERDVIVKGYISNWVKEQLLIIEAEKNLPPTININQLVEEYKASLLLNYYEDKMVEEMLDTIITDIQMREAYDKYKEEFSLQENLIKTIALKVPRLSDKDRKSFEKVFKNEGIEEIDRLASQRKTTPLLKGDTWVPVSEVLALLPNSLFDSNDISKKGSLSKKDAKYEYFVKILAYNSKDETPPLEYVEGKIGQIIMNSRKKTIINRKKQQLYDQNLNGNRIKIKI